MSEPHTDHEGSAAVEPLRSKDRATRHRAALESFDKWLADLPAGPTADMAVAARAAIAAKAGAVDEAGAEGAMDEAIAEVILAASGALALAKLMLGVDVCPACTRARLVRALGLFAQFVAPSIGMSQSGFALAINFLDAPAGTPGPAAGEAVH